MHPPGRARFDVMGGVEHEGMVGFERFVQARSATLLRSAYLLAGDRHLAEDLLQDTLAKVAQHWEAIERDGNPEAYARTVLYHRAVDTWRTRLRRPRVVGDLTREPTDGGDPFVDSDRRLLLRCALARLTPKQRAVLVLRFYEDRTEAQSAEVLGCSVSTVKSTTRTALERLRISSPELTELTELTQLTDRTVVSP
jgi:RNA polymerase sigma-70 factor (sigma-E family)